MAQASQPLGYMCRSCRQALRFSGTRQTQPSTRSFSSTPGRSKTLATFTPTASPELDALLATWRSEVFLPSILPPHHTRLIYKESKKEILTTAPGVTVTVQTALPPGAKNATEAGEENIKLQPMNSFDRPNVAKSLEQITRALSETGDAATWDNLIPFLEGMQLARQSVGKAFLPRLARKANLQNKGRWNTILTAATMAKRTDVRLDQRELTRELVLGAHHRGASSAFSSNGPGKTVEKIVLLLEADEHCGKYHLARVSQIERQLAQNDPPTSATPAVPKRQLMELRNSTDMRRDPLVVAASLSFASAKAIRDSEGKDTDGAVAKTAQKLLAIVDSLEGGLIEYIRQWHEKEGKRHAAVWWRDSLVLEELSVIRCALELANKVDMQSTLGKQKNVQIHTAIRKQLDTIVPAMATARSSIMEAPGDQQKNTERRSIQMADAVQSTVQKL